VWKVSGEGGGGGAEENGGGEEGEEGRGEGEGEGGVEGEKSEEEEVSGAAVGGWWDELGKGEVVLYMHGCYDWGVELVFAVHSCFTCQLVVLVGWQ